MKYTGIWQLSEGFFFNTKVDLTLGALQWGLDEVNMTIEYI